MKGKVALIVLVVVTVVLSGCRLIPGLGPNGEETSDGSGFSIPALEEDYARIKGFIEGPAGLLLEEVAGAGIQIIGQGVEELGNQFDPATGEFFYDLSTSIRGIEDPFAPNEYQLLIRDTANSLGIKVDGFQLQSGQIEELQSALQLEPTGSITGSVTLSDGNSPIDSFVSVPGTSINGTADSNGAFTLSNVPAGTYEVLRVTRDGYFAGVVSNVTVSADSTTDVGALELVLSTGANGTVVINNDEPFTTSQTVTLTVGASDDAVLMMISENETFSGADWQPLQNELDFTFSDAANETKTVWVKFANANGLESSGVSDSITLNTDPTALVPQSPTSTSVVDPRVIFDWSDVADADAIPDEVYDLQVASDSNFTNIILDQSGLTASEFNGGQATEVVSSDGPYHWQVRVRIPSESKTGDWYGSSFSIQGTPSSLSVAGVTSDTTPELSWAESFVDGDTKIEVYSDSGMTSLETSGTVSASPWSPISSLSDGTYYWRARSENPSGSYASNWVSGTSFDIDTQAPTIDTALELDGGAAYTFVRDVSGTVSISDQQPDADLEMQLSEDPAFTNATTTSWVTYSGGPSFTLDPYTYDEVADDNRTVYIRFRDTAGNVSNASSDTIVLDPNVYVNASGSDTNSGHKNAPVATLSQAVAIAASYAPNDVRIYGSGTGSPYDLGASGLIIAAPISLLGGYDSTFATRDASTYGTAITSSDLFTIKYDAYSGASITSATKLDGIELANSGNPGNNEFAAAVWLGQASPTLSNISIQMQGEQEALTENTMVYQPGIAGVFIDNSNSLLDSVSIAWDPPTDGYHGITAQSDMAGAAGIFSYNSSFTLTNSSIEGGRGQAKSERNVGSAGVAIFQGSGTIDANTSISAYSADTSDANGTNYSAGSAGVFILDAAGFVISNNSTIQSGQGNNTSGTTNGLAGSAGIWIAFSDGEIYGNGTIQGGSNPSALIAGRAVGSAGIAIAGGSAVDIYENDTITGGTGSATSTQSAGSAGIWTSYVSDLITIARNGWIEGGAGSADDAGSVGSTGIFANPSSSFGGSIEIRNNLIVSTDGTNANASGIDSAAIHTYGGGSTANIIVNNTLVTRSSADLSAVLSFRGGAWKVANNIVASESTATSVYGAYELGTSSDPDTFYGNLIWDNGSLTALYYDDGSDVTTQNSLNGLTDGTFGQNIASSQTATLLFAAPSSDTYTLAGTGSDAYDTGLDVSSSYGVTVDFQGEARPKGSQYDIGYDEY